MQDSPTSKLLYNKEVQGYKAQVKKYYDNVRNLPRIPEDAMQYYLKQLSTVSLSLSLSLSSLSQPPHTMMVYHCSSISFFSLQYQSQQMRNTGGPGFVVESALQDLLRYAHKYQEPVSYMLGMGIGDWK